MSITPMPDLPPDPDGIHISAIDSYIGRPGALPGVSFWPRVGARVIDLIVHYLIAICSGFLVGILVVTVAALQHTSAHVLLAHQSHGIALFAFSLLGSVVLETICEGFHGSTPGKFLFSMVVVPEDGSPCRATLSVDPVLCLFCRRAFLRFDRLSQYAEKSPAAAPRR
jgi:hypothetical protein